MFNAKMILARASMGAAAILLSSCGGGGSATGGSTDFSVLPSKWTFTSADGDLACQGVEGSEVNVTVVGGTPPYRLINSVPQNMSISDTVLTGKNPSFKVVVHAGCGTDMPILILDNLSRSITFTMTVEKGEAATDTAL